MKIRIDSTEFIYGTVTADHDLAEANIEVALPVTGEPPQTWYTAAITEVVTGTDTWTATYRLLVGPEGSVELSVGKYDWTFRLTDTPEVPVRKAGTVEATEV
jgi:hypothetical protein